MRIPRGIAKQQRGKIIGVEAEKVKPESLPMRHDPEQGIVIPTTSELEG
jgi:hypothetical protein